MNKRGLVWMLGERTRYGCHLLCSSLLLMCVARFVLPNREGGHWQPPAVLSAQRGEQGRALSSRITSLRRRPNNVLPPGVIREAQPTSGSAASNVIADLQLPSIPVQLLLSRGRFPAYSRADFLSRNMTQQLSLGLCVEIGPKDIPALPPDHPNARFLDYLDQAALRLKHASDRSIKTERIPFIHYIWTGQQSYRELTHGGHFQLVIASHVAEHVPDLITWLRQIGEVLTADGILRLVIPDKRYCFDFRRRLSGVADLAEAYIERRTKPSVAAAYDNAARVPPKHNSARMHWAGSPLDYELTEDLHTTAFAAATKALTEGDFGVHSWQWTPETFVYQMAILFRAGLIPLKVKPGSVVPTKLNGLEFMLEMELKK